MIDRESAAILRKLIAQWDDLRAAIGRLNSAAQIRPSEGIEVFRPSEGESRALASFEIRPVVFNLPERADARCVDLFVVVAGRLSFGLKDSSGDTVLSTREFGTKVAYFRRSATCLAHVYGAHYDFSLEEIGHPVFHGQIRSYKDLADNVKERFGVGQVVDDRVAGVLKAVRVPTAHMDVFSLFVQLCADHLLFTNSGRDEKAAFNSILAKSAFCRGAASQVPRLETEEARRCYRARHWYPTVD